MASRTDAVEAELERRLVRRIAVAVAVATPISILFWIGVIWLSVGLSGASVAGALVMGAGIGVLAGLFWGAWAAFAFYSPVLDEHDRDHSAAEDSDSSGHPQENNQA